MKKIVLGAAVALAVTSSAFAGLTDGVTYNTADVVAVGGLVLAAVASIWGVRKAIAMANRG